MTVIGITGLYASGKSTLARELEKQGWYQIEVDALGHQALEGRREALKKAFGPQILKPDGRSVDRRKLGSMVFADPEALKTLESIVHPEMKRRVREMISDWKDRVRSTGAPKSGVNGTGDPAGKSAGGPPGVIINAAILYKMKLEELCDFVIWVQVPLITRIFRARRRDGLTWKELFKRIRSQKSLNPQLVKQNVDMYKVDNFSRRAALKRIDDILQVRVWSKTRPTL